MCFLENINMLMIQDEGGLLLLQADLLSGFHGNTHIPIVVGAQKRYEITGDLLYKVFLT